MTDKKAIRHRNFYALIVEGTFFWVGFAFLDANSVVPVFINTYTGSLYLAGLASTLRIASTLIAQLIIGPHIQRIKNLPAFIIKIMLFFRPLPLLMIPVLLLSKEPFLPVWVFLAIFSLLWMSDGLIVVPWLDIFGRTIESSIRGKVLGYQLVLGSSGSLLAGLVIKFALEHPYFTDAIRYSIIFGSSGIVLLMSCIAMSFVKDFPREVIEQKPNPIDFFAKLPSYFKKNALYARVVVIQVIAGFGWMVMPFVILYNKETFALNPIQISNIVYTQIVGSLIGGILWGNVSHKLGNKYVITISQGISFLLSLTVLSSQSLAAIIDPFYLAATMSVMAGISMGAWMGFSNYTIDVVEESERPIYFVLTSVVTLPLAFLPFISGLSVNAWGFSHLFVISLCAAALSFLLSLKLKG